MYKAKLAVAGAFIPLRDILVCFFVVVFFSGKWDLILHVNCFQRKQLAWHVSPFYLLGKKKRCVNSLSILNLSRVLEDQLFYLAFPENRT